jgi:hypothetical protein
MHHDGPDNVAGHQGVLCEQIHLVLSIGEHDLGDEHNEKGVEMGVELFYNVVVEEEYEEVHNQDLGHNVETVSYREAKVSYREAKVPDREAKVPDREAKVSYREAKVYYREAKVLYYEAMVSYREAKVPYHEAMVSYRVAKVPYREVKVPYHDDSNVHDAPDIQDVL